MRLIKKGQMAFGMTTDLVHIVLDDSYGWGGPAAYCGAMVARELSYAAPTCVRCIGQQAIYRSAR